MTICGTVFECYELWVVRVPMMICVVCDIAESSYLRRVFRQTCTRLDYDLDGRLPNLWLGSQPSRPARWYRRSKGQSQGVSVVVCVLVVVSVCLKIGVCVPVGMWLHITMQAIMPVLAYLCYIQTRVCVYILFTNTFLCVCM